LHGADDDPLRPFAAVVHHDRVPYPGEQVAGWIPPAGDRPASNMRINADGTMKVEHREPYAATVHDDPERLYNPDRNAVYVLHEHTPAQRERFRAIVDRVSARLAEENRRDIMGQLAGRRRKAGK
jgi:hypothetical protein